MSTAPDRRTVESFRLGYVPGVSPGKWVRIWGERVQGTPLDLVQLKHQTAADELRSCRVDAALLRLPVDRSTEPALSVIPLYTETTVVVVPKEHLLCALDEARLDDLADETVWHPDDDVLDWAQVPGRAASSRPTTTAETIELVAAGVGLVLVPQSLARLHHRRDLTYRPITDAVQSQVGLAWPEDATTDLVEEFIGIVRGRTVNSSRGRSPAVPQQKAKPARKGNQSPRRARRH
ncbi:LysR family transcriptional regulator [Skermania sp. ID1734]|uniref:LysR family substrate-binding domain-containing protein n=1 Tax=Skermania sp. ID1734 TaxID=2597516 RepID=UPI0011805CBC|nr:LysR family substrate-binding domain-containing protein [Skermania sp. ID1734]TSD96049.1 LysR family transcriptional regulator [Skermania sp. ID1734]